MLDKNNFIVFGTNVIHKSVARTITMVTMGFTPGDGIAFGRVNRYNINIYGQATDAPMLQTAYTSVAERDAVAAELMAALFQTGCDTVNLSDETDSLEEVVHHE